ncbi:MAG: phosphoglycerate kinase [Flavobacteriales bacterium]|nr:phosphoglycerate kinase [Flavobacteriales bacterium]
MIHFADYNFAGKKAIVRVDFNVPLNKETLDITDDTRIRASIPTINKIIDDGGSVILMSHLGRPKNGPEDKFSLKHILPSLSKLLNKDVDFSEDCIGTAAEEKANRLVSGSVLLLENLRFYKHETAGSDVFAKQLANLADVYVNDAFGTAHRAHASTTIIAQYFPNVKMYGYLIEKEIESVSKVLHESVSPVTAIVGGAKVSSKIIIINELLEKVDNLIIGGGMTYTFVKAMVGNVGTSLVENDYLETAKEIIAKAKEKKVQLILPKDTVAADSFANAANKMTCESISIPDNWMGLDIGPKAIVAYVTCIENSKTVLWNGPMGVFEMENFREGTKQVALAIANATKNGAFSLIGGGDSVAAINLFNLADQVSHVSTGGGAMLEYLEGKELPGIKAITE